MALPAWPLRAPSLLSAFRSLTIRPTTLTQTRAFAAPRNRAPREEKEAEEDEIEIPTRVLPVSASYFTGTPTYTDDVLVLQELLRKHSMLPKVPNAMAPKVKWRTMHDYVASTGIRESKYKKVLGILKELNRIDPEYMPGEVLEELERFKRPEQGGGALAKVRGLNEWGVSMATGRRKTSVSRVKVVEGNGEVLVNGKTLDEAFSRKHDRESVIWPMRVTGRMDKYNIWAECTGGGTTGQAEAIALGVSKALMIHEPLLKPVLRRAGVVTRDPRMVERKKPGHLKARKMPTWVKR